VADTDLRPAPLSHENIPYQSARSPHVIAIAGITTILCVSFVLKIALATGPVGSDDMSYFRGAAELLRQGWIPELHHHLGRKLFIILAGIPAVLGGNIMYGAIANICYIELLDIAVVAFVYREFGATAAFVAAVIIGFNGPELLWSGTLLPDMMVALFMFTSAVALYYGLLPASMFRVRKLAFSGALAGVSYAVKEPGILLVPPALMCILLGGEVRVTKRLESCVVYIAAFIAVFVAEGLLQLWLSGDFFYREHALQAAHNSQIPPVPLAQFIRETYWTVASIATRYREALLLPAVAGVASWAVLILKRSPLSVFAVTGLFVGAYLTFGTTSFPELRPLPFQPRYLAPLFPLIAVCLASLFRQNGSSGRGARVTWAVGLSVYAMISIYSAVIEAGDLSRARYFKNAAAAVEFELARDPPVEIRVEPKVLEVLMQLLPRADYDKLKSIPSGKDLPAGLYITDPLPVSGAPDQAAIDLQQISSLPVVATFDLNPLWLSRYFPNFGSDIRHVPLTIAVVREKEAGR